jgi:hypothetical protein
MFICNHCPFVKHLKKDIAKLTSFYMEVRTLEEQMKLSLNFFAGILVLTWIQYDAERTCFDRHIPKFSCDASPGYELGLTTNEHECLLVCFCILLNQEVLILRT